MGQADDFDLLVKSGRQGRATSCHPSEAKYRGRRPTACHPVGCGKRSRSGSFATLKMTNIRLSAVRFFCLLRPRRGQQQEDFGGTVAGPRHKRFLSCAFCALCGCRLVGRFQTRSEPRADPKRGHALPFIFFTDVPKIRGMNSFSAAEIFTPRHGGRKGRREVRGTAHSVILSIAKDPV